MVYGFDENKGKVDINAILDELETNYQGNIDTLYNAIVATGVTPASKSPADIAASIADIYNTAQSVTWSETVSGLLGGGNRVEYSIKNAKAMQLSVDDETEVSFINTSGGSPVSTRVLSAGTYTLTPSTAFIAITPGDVIFARYTLTITRQAKILR